MYHLITAVDNVTPGMTLRYRNDNPPIFSDGVVVLDSDRLLTLFHGFVFAQIPYDLMSYILDPKGYPLPDYAVDVIADLVAGVT